MKSNYIKYREFFSAASIVHDAIEMGHIDGLVQDCSNFIANALGPDSI